MNAYFTFRCKYRCLRRIASIIKLNFAWLKEAYLSDPEILDYKDEKECWYSNYKSLHQQSSPPGRHHCGQHQRLVSQHQDRGA